MLEQNHLVDHAIRIAAEAHAGQKDRYDAPYILHVLRVGMRGETEAEITAGILHDVVEDSDAWTVSRLEEEGFPQDIIAAVDCLTKREGERWDDYIGRVLESRMAMQVKLYDLEDNMRAFRAPSFGDAEYERFQRYVRAWHTIHARLDRE